ncbi:Rhodopsin, GQ-coupled [Trichoplax sp. H2]|nr:Rhodopsin, GQ-coupled [Trichoplax sp. H2]|eukprot:RDD37900.1 Rhodopsin, GQ-coupled [Trichoplax sp. H2]
MSYVSQRFIINSTAPKDINGSKWLSRENNLQSILNITLPILLTFTVFGCMANSIVCWIIWKKRELHTPTFYLIMNMAISDCAILCMSSLQLLNDYTLLRLKIRPQEIKFIIFCRLLPIFCLTAYISSTFTLAAISIERFYSISSWSNNKSYFNTRKKLRLVIGFSWLVGIIVASPFAAIVTVPGRFPWICIIVKINIVLSSIYFLTLFLIAYLCPLVVMVIMYTKIILFLRSHFVIHQQNDLKTYQANKKRHIRIVKKLILLTSLFLTLSFPLFFLYLLMGFSGKSSYNFLKIKNPRNIILSEVGFLLTVVSCLQNPLLYFSFNPAFRKAITINCLCYQRSKRQISVKSAPGGS